jgi:hypothetical protein
MSKCSFGAAPTSLSLRTLVCLAGVARLVHSADRQQPGKVVTYWPRCVGSGFVPTRIKTRSA